MLEMKRPSCKNYFLKFFHASARNQAETHSFRNTQEKLFHSCGVIKSIYLDPVRRNRFIVAAYAF